MDRSKTPRSLIRFMQSDSSHDARPNREARDLVRAFISADGASSGTKERGQTIESKPNQSNPKLVREFPVDAPDQSVPQVSHSDSISHNPSHDRSSSAKSQKGRKVNFKRRGLSSESASSRTADHRRTDFTPYTSVELCLTCINVTLLMGVLAISTFLLCYFYLLNHTLSTRISL